MGQKVNPTGFRLGITEEWRSRWYADKDYAKNLENDLAIRKFLNKYLARAAVSKVEIERAGDKIKVIVTTARPGVVIGKKGAEIDTLRKSFGKIRQRTGVRGGRGSQAPRTRRRAHRPVRGRASSKAASRSAAPCARRSSPPASRAPRASASSAPAAWAARR